MRLHRFLLATAALGAVAFARPAAAGTALGLGADYLADPQTGAFQLTLVVEKPVTRWLAVGGRFGALIATEPTRFGVPLDVRLRARLGSVYLDGLVGPWVIFDDADALRLHAGIGFGLLTHSMSIGIEVGYLDPTSMIGLRLAFPL